MVDPLIPVVTDARIYLNGFMGSGKSTLGPLVAERLRWVFSDLDDRIVDVIGMPIGAYFREKGEPAFREIEAEQLRATAGAKNTVISVGGGALCQEENLVWALRNGVVVFLRVDPGELARRLTTERTTRPMLLQKDGSVIDEEALSARIAFLLELREEYYSQAHYVVDAGSASMEETVTEIVRLVRRTPSASAEEATSGN